MNAPTKSAEIAFFNDDDTNIDVPENLLENASEEISGIKNWNSFRYFKFSFVDYGCVRFIEKPLEMSK